MDKYIIKSSLQRAFEKIVITLFQASVLYTVLYFAFPNLKLIFTQNLNIIVGSVIFIIVISGILEYMYYMRNLKYLRYIRDIKDNKIKLEQIVLNQEALKEIINKKIQFYSSLAPTSIVIFISGILVDNNFKLTNELSNKNIIIYVFICLFIGYILRIKFLYGKHDEICWGIKNANSIIKEKYDVVNN